VASVSYTAWINLFKNVNLVIEFTASSQPRLDAPSNSRSIHACKTPSPGLASRASRAPAAAGERVEFLCRRDRANIARHLLNSRKAGGGAASMDDVIEALKSALGAEAVLTGDQIASATSMTGAGKLPLRRARWRGHGAPTKSPRYFASVMSTVSPSCRRAA